MAPVPKFRIAPGLSEVKGGRGRGHRQRKPNDAMAVINDLEFLCFTARAKEKNWRGGEWKNAAEQKAHQSGLR